MSTTDQLSRLAPYATRLLDDDAVRDQLDRAVSNLRDGSRRARSQGAKKAVTDRQTRRQLSAAAVAATQIVRRLREPEPPKRHLGRRALGLAVVAGGAVVGYRRRSASSPESSGG
jgi:hypothetical protein